MQSITINYDIKGNIEKTLKNIKDGMEASKDSGDKFEQSLNEINKSVNNLNKTVGFFSGNATKIFGVLGVSFGFKALISDAHEANMYFWRLHNTLNTISDSFGNTSEAMSTAFAAHKSSMQTIENTIEILKGLADTGITINRNYADLAGWIGGVAQSSGLASATLTNLVGNAHQLWKVSQAGTKEMVHALFQAQKSFGMTSSQLDELSKTIDTTHNKLAALFTDGEKSSIALSKGIAMSVGMMKKMGVNAQEANQFVSNMLDPEKLSQNTVLLRRLGITYKDQVDMMSSEEGKASFFDKLMTNLPKISNELGRIKDPFVRMNIAKNLGLPLELANKMAGKTTEEIRGMITEYQKGQKAADKKQEKAKADQARWDESIRFIRYQALLPMMEFLQKTYAKWLPFLSQLSKFASYGVDFVAKLLEGMVDKMQPVYDVFMGKKPFDTKVISSAIGETIRGAFDHVADGVTKVIDFMAPVVKPIVGLMFDGLISMLSGFAGLVGKAVFAVFKQSPIMGTILGAYIAYKMKVAVLESIALTKTIPGLLTKIWLNFAGQKAAGDIPTTMFGKLKEAFGKGKKGELGKNVLSGDAGKNFMKSGTNPFGSIKEIMDAKKSGLLSDISKTKNMTGSAGMFERSKLIGRQGVLDAAGKMGEKVGTMGKAVSGSRVGQIASLTGKGAMGAARIGGTALMGGAQVLGSGLVSMLGPALKIATGPIGLIVGGIAGAFSSANKAGEMFGRTLNKDEKDRLKMLTLRRTAGERLTKEEQAEIAMLEQKTKATTQEKVAAGMAGGLSLGILPLIDKMFGTDLTAGLAKGIKGVMNFFGSEQLTAVENTEKEKLEKMKDAMNKGGKAMTAEEVNRLDDLTQKNKSGIRKLWESAIDKDSGISGFLHNFADNFTASHGSLEESLSSTGPLGTIWKGAMTTVKMGAAKMFNVNEMLGRQELSDKEKQALEMFKKKDRLGIDLTAKEIKEQERLMIKKKNASVSTWSDVLGSAFGRITGSIIEFFGGENKSFDLTWTFKKHFKNIGLYAKDFFNGFVVGFARLGVAFDKWYYGLKIVGDKDKQKRAEEIGEAIEGLRKGENIKKHQDTLKRLEYQNSSVDRMVGIQTEIAKNNAETEEEKKKSAAERDRIAAEKAQEELKLLREANKTSKGMGSGINKIAKNTEPKQTRQVDYITHMMRSLGKSNDSRHIATG